MEIKLEINKGITAGGGRREKDVGWQAESEWGRNSRRKVFGYLEAIHYPLETIQIK